MYKLKQSPSITRLTDGASIPADPANIDYGNYLIWLSEGNIPEPADIILSPQIAVVTMRQARLALLSVGNLAKVNTAIASLTGTAGDKAKIEWEFASEIKIDSELVISMGEFLSLTQDQLQDLFNLAATL